MAAVALASPLVAAIVTRAGESLAAVLSHARGVPGLGGVLARKRNDENQRDNLSGTKRSVVTTFLLASALQCQTSALSRSWSRP
eukprot:7136777-Prymnesium_polylepis.1